jgi:hypothetical protein
MERATLPEERFFEVFFGFLTEGEKPFRWQREIFRLFLRGEIPSTIDIPTGCGKTALMEIWVSALAWQALHGRVSLPRRLVWIVNRRTVVDQATETAEKIRRKLEGLKETDKRTYEALKNMSSVGKSGGPLIAVSTLRGELADNEEWKEDPTRPSIIVGTVDMIGSRPGPRRRLQEEPAGHGGGLQGLQGQEGHSQEARPPEGGKGGGEGQDRGGGGQAGQGLQGPPLGGGMSSWGGGYV